MTEISLLGLRTATTSAFSDDAGRTRAGTPFPHSYRGIWRRWGAIAIAAALLPGCVNSKFQTADPVRSFVFADEPQAANVGRDIIKQGGRVGDAAAAMALTMAATLPSRVGLAGGGVCVTFDSARKEARTIDFLPRPAGTGGAAMPGMLRGIYTVHAMLGELRWEQVSVPAEQIAQFSPTVSRALAQDLADFGNRLPADSEARRRLLPTGSVPAVGSPLSQPDLAASLSVIRRNGVGAFYNGQLTAAVAQGLGIDAASLRGYQPKVGGTVSIPLGITNMHFAQMPEPDSGAALAAAWKAAADLKPAERGAAIAKALGATGNGAAVPGAGLVVIDPKENGIACTLTMGAPFGTGRVVPGTGVLAAQPVDRAGSLAPGLVGNSIIGRTLFVGAGTAKGNEGPTAGAAALLGAAIPAAVDETVADQIQAARPASLPGRVSFVACQVSIDNGVRSCQLASDPRAAGLGSVIDMERER